MIDVIGSLLEPGSVIIHQSVHIKRFVISVLGEKIVYNGSPAFTVYHLDYRYKVYVKNYFDLSFFSTGKVVSGNKNFQENVENFFKSEEYLQLKQSLIQDDIVENDFVVYLETGDSEAKVSLGRIKKVTAKGFKVQHFSLSKNVNRTLFREKNMVTKVFFNDKVKSLPDEWVQPLLVNKSEIMSF